LDKISFGLSRYYEAKLLPVFTLAASIANSGVKQRSGVFLSVCLSVPSLQPDATSVNTHVEKNRQVDNMRSCTMWVWRRGKSSVANVNVVRRQHAFWSFSPRADTLVV